MSKDEPKMPTLNLLFPQSFLQLQRNMKYRDQHIQGITLEGGSGDDLTWQWLASGTKMELKLGSIYANMRAAQIEASSLDISGNVDVDGTLEADAITVNGSTLSSVIILI